MIYPWRQIGRVAKRLTQSALIPSEIYVFNQEQREELKTHLLKRHDTILLKDLQRAVDSIEEDAFRSKHPSIESSIGRKCSIVSRQKKLDTLQRLGHGRFRQCPK